MSGPLKQHWAKVCNDYMSWKSNDEIQFSLFFNQAWFKTINPETTISGFHKVGVCPFNAILQIRFHLPPLVMSHPTTMTMAFQVATLAWLKMWTL